MSTVVCLPMLATTDLFNLSQLNRSFVLQSSVISPALFNHFVSGCPITDLGHTNYALFWWGGQVGNDWPFLPRNPVWHCTQVALSLAGLPQFHDLPPLQIDFDDFFFLLTLNSRRWPSPLWPSAGPLHLHLHLISPMVRRSISPSANQQQQPSPLLELAFPTVHF